MLPSYSTGTVDVADGGTTVTGTGSNWTGANAKPGDLLQIGEFQTIVSDVTDATHLVVPPWGGGAQSGATYVLWKTSPLRFAGGDAMADVSTLVATLNTDGFYVLVAPELTEPDPSYGEEDQFALQPSTGKLWLKTGGVWVFQGVYKGFNITGAWSGATDYVVGDVATVSGSSYICILGHTNQTPPNVTYWQLLASKGDTGATGSQGPTSGIRQAYSTTTTDSDPGNGIFRLNNATPASATAAYLDNLDAGGATVSGIFDLFDDSTSTTRGFIRFEKATDPTVWAQFRVTGSVVDGTGYRKLTLASGAGSGSFTNADVFAISFYRTGDSSSGDLLAANNLSDLANAQTARGNLGVTAVGSAAVGHIPGETSNGNAASGEVGEIIEFSLGVTGLTTGAGTVNLANGSFPAGDWDIWGFINIGASGATSLTNYTFSISATSATHDQSVVDRYVQYRNAGGHSDPIISQTIGPHRRSLSGSTTLYLTASATFSSTLSVVSKIRGRRVR